MDKLISVVIPVYNVETTLRKCVDSVLAQTYDNTEVILVNDGSTDSSEKICRRYEQIDPRVKVISKENGGLSSGRYLHDDRANAAAVLTGAVPLDEAVQKVDGPFSLVFGNEASGLPDAFAQMGVSTLIPHSHQIDSLNLAIAAGIGMYAFTRR